MKMIKIVSVCGLAASLLCGCGKNEGCCGGNAGPAEPRIGDGSVAAVGIAMPSQGKFKATFDKAYAKLKAESAKEKDLREGFEFCEKAGVDLMDLRWALLTSKRFMVENGKLTSTPEAALAVSIKHDLKKLVAAIPESGEHLENVKIAGCEAFQAKASELPSEMQELKVCPVLVSIDGKVLVLASTVAEAERQVALYREGKGVSGEYPGFTLGKDDFVRIAAPNVGKTLSEAVGDELDNLDEIVPDGKAMATGLGLLQLSVLTPGGNAIDFALEATLAKAEHAKSLADMLNGFLQPVKAQCAKKVKRGYKEAVLGQKVLDSLKVEAAGTKLMIKIPVPAELVDEGFAEFEKELLK